MSRAGCPTYRRLSAHGRHGVASLPKGNLGQHAVLTLPRDRWKRLAGGGWEHRRMRCHRIPTSLKLFFNSVIDPVLDAALDSVFSFNTPQ